MKVRVSGNAGCRDMELPVEGAKLAWLVERIGGGSRNFVGYAGKSVGSERADGCGG